MNLVYGDLSKYKKLCLNGSILNYGGRIFQYGDGILLKLISDDYSYLDDVERDIEFLIQHVVPNSPKIYDKVYMKGSFEGYLMEYLRDTVTFKEALLFDFSFFEKYGAVLDIYRAIHYLHQHNLCLGDIHLDNVLISKNGCGYVIDLDYMVFPGDEWKFEQMYCVKLNHGANKLIKSSIFHDNIKAFLCSISLILGVNLENLIKDSVIDLEDVYFLYYELLREWGIDSYLERLIVGEKVEYFDEFLMTNCCHKILKK